MILLSAPIGIYSFVFFNPDPFLRSWTAQNLILSPPIGDYILAFITLLPLTLYGVYLVFKTNQREGSLLGLWVVLFPILAYAPYNLQRRLPEGIWVAVVLLAMLVIESKFNRFERIVKIWGSNSLSACIGFLRWRVICRAKPCCPIICAKG